MEEGPQKRTGSIRGDVVMKLVKIWPTLSVERQRLICVSLGGEFVEDEDDRLAYIIRALIDCSLDALCVLEGILAAFEEGSNF